MEERLREGAESEKVREAETLCVFSPFYRIIPPPLTTGLKIFLSSESQPAGVKSAGARSAYGVLRCFLSFGGGRSLNSAAALGGQFGLFGGRVLY